MTSLYRVVVGSVELIRLGLPHVVVRIDRQGTWTTVAAFADEQNAKEYAVVCERDQL